MAATTARQGLTKLADALFRLRRPQRELTYEAIAARAQIDYQFREGLVAAALVCRSQGQESSAPPCPSGVAAFYIERLADGEMP